MLDDLPPEANVDKQTYAEWGIRSVLDIPIITGGSIQKRPLLPAQCVSHLDPASPRKAGGYSSARLGVCQDVSRKEGKEIETISKKTMEALQSYPWPGNVRELKNLIEHAMILSNDKTLPVRLPQPGSLGTDATQTLQDMERRHILAVLVKTGWRLSGDGGAAEVLGLKRTTLRAKMKRLGIKRSNKTQDNG
jgi:hypothetical protein